MDYSIKKAFIQSQYVQYSHKKQWLAHFFSAQQSLILLYIKNPNEFNTVRYADFEFGEKH